MEFPRSGTEEEYGEKEQLLQEVADLATEFRGEDRKRKTAKTEGIAARNEATAEYAHSVVEDVPQYTPMIVLHGEEVVHSEEIGVVSENDIEHTDVDVLYNVVPATETPAPVHSCNLSSTSYPQLKRKQEPLKGSTLGFLQGKQKRNLELEEKKLAVQERELQVKEERWQFEKKEREERWELEVKERKKRWELEKKEREERWEFEKKQREERVAFDRKMEKRRMVLEETCLNTMAAQQNLITELIHNLKK